MSDVQIQRLYNVIAGLFFILFLLGLSKMFEVEPDPQRRSMSFEASRQVRAHLECAKPENEFQTEIVYFDWGPRKVIRRYDIQSEGGVVTTKLKKCKLVKD